MKDSFQLQFHSGSTVSVLTFSVFPITEFTTIGSQLVVHKGTSQVIGKLLRQKVRVRQLSLRQHQL